MKKQSINCFKYFSSVVSGTVLMINSIGPVYAETSMQKNITSPIWLSCKKIGGSIVDCNNNESYELITDPKIIKRLGQELKSKDIKSFVAETIEVGGDEIDKFFKFLDKKDSDVYKEPTLKLNKLLSTEEELKLKDQLKKIHDKISKNPNIDIATLYSDPQLNISNLSKDQLDRVLKSSRRNNYAITEDKNAAYAACGIAAVVVVNIAVSIVSSKVDAGGDGPNNPGHVIIKKNEIDDLVIPYVVNHQKNDC